MKQRQNVWVRATAGAGKVTAAYGEIVNSGTTDDELVSVSTPKASMSHIHKTSETGGVMKMEAVHSLIIPANGRVELKPGGYHVMISNVTRPLKVGDTVELTFTFRNQGPVKVIADAIPLSTQHKH